MAEYIEQTLPATDRAIDPKLIDPKLIDAVAIAIANERFHRQNVKPDPNVLLRLPPREVCLLRFDAEAAIRAMVVFAQYGEG